MRSLSRKLISASIALLVLVFSLSISVYADSAVSNDEVLFENYTYWRDISGGNSRTPVAMQPLYKTSKILDIKSIMSDGMDGLADIYCSDDGKTYLLSADSSILTVLDEDYRVIRTITGLRDENGAEVSFKGASGLYVTDEDSVYLCGTESGCVWCIDRDGNIKYTFTLPDSEVIPENFVFAPIKTAVDGRGYVYILSRGSYYGALLYSPEREFIGFYGANTTGSTVTQILTNIWNKLFMNDAKKSASLKSLPYSFSDLTVGDDNFIYTITGKTTTTPTGQLKVFNPAGTDILGKSNYNFADTESVKAGRNAWVGQDLSGIEVSGSFVYVLDTDQGKIFLYDIKGNIIGVFGGGMGKGKQKGLFESPVAITVKGSDVLILDRDMQTITVFTPTDYGRLVLECQTRTLKAKYTDAAAGWEEVLRIDKNSQIAYRGLARAALREENYAESMRLAKIGADRDTYAEAFGYYRKDLLVANLGWLLPLLVVLIAAAVGCRLILKKKQIKLAVGNNMSNYCYTLLHPFDGFGRVAEKKAGSVLIGVGLCILLYLSALAKEVLSGFSYSYYNPVTFNTLFLLLRTVGAIVLWTVVNWAVCTLFGGLGKMKSIFIVITYSVTPLIVSNLLYALLSNVLVKNEAGFLNIMVILFWIFTAFLLIAGTVKIHDFSFGKFVGTALLTLIGILIVIFLGFIIFLLMQQFVSFAATLVSEMIYR